MINYSIIIPHKNTSELLERLLNTIPWRDDLEVIVVDDNSDRPLSELPFISNMQNHYNLCLVELKEGRGAGHARNAGLERAVGTWVYFADADDYFTPHFSELLDKFYQNDDIDMVFVNAKGVNDAGVEIPLSLNRYITNYLSKRPFALDVLRHGFWAPWSRLTKRAIFIDNNIYFEEVPVGNDVMAIVTASHFANTFDVEENICYMYYKPMNGSQTSKMYNEKTYIQRFEQHLRLNNLYKEWGYRFFWPTRRAFNNKLVNTGDEVVSLKRKYRYSAITDYFNYFRYVVAKILKII